MAPTDDCLFCRIAAGKVPSSLVHEDADLVAFHDIRPEAPTHILVVPRRHVASVAALSPEDGPLVGRLVLAARRIAAEQNLEATGYRLVLNTGEWAGQTVHHLHLHLLGGRRMAWPPG
jgi:histidine triad (HIT) family protein